MRWFILLIGLLLSWQANAQVGQVGQFVYAPVGGAPCTYVGPGSAVSGASLYYGLRGNSCASVGTTAITLRRASDSATQGFVILANGDLDVASAVTFCASTSCFVSAWTEQTGHQTPLVQAVAANQPGFVFNCIGSHPCVTTTPTQWLEGPAGTIAQPWSVSSVFLMTAVNQWFWGQSSSFALGSSTTVVDFLNFYTGIVSTVPATFNVWHSTQSTANGVSTTVQIDATASGALNGSSNAISGTHDIGGLSPGGSSGSTGKIMELMVFPSVLSGSPGVTMCHNQFLYFGLPVSC